jgi:hypothetical protein
VTADGYGRILQPEWLPVPPKPNSKARSQIARRSAAVALCPAENACLVTNRRLVALDTANLLREDSTKTTRLLKSGRGGGGGNGHMTITGKTQLIGLIGWPAG